MLLNKTTKNDMLLVLIDGNHGMTMIQLLKQIYNAHGGDKTVPFLSYDDKLKHLPSIAPMLFCAP